MAAVRHVEFLKNFQILMANKVKRVNLCHYINLCRLVKPLPRHRNFPAFKMAAVCHLGSVLCKFGPPKEIIR